MGELGVFVAEGRISFRPLLLRKAEFLSEAADFHYFDLSGRRRRLRLPPGSLAFTYCQVPVVYRLGQKSRLVVRLATGEETRAERLTLDTETSRSIFSRDGRIERMTLTLRGS
jgi:hypothetical protein